MNLQEARGELVTRQRALYEKQGQWRALQNRREELFDEIADLTQVQARLAKAIDVLTTYADKTEKDALDKAQGLATLGLSTVFGEEIQLFIRQTQRGNLTAADISIRTELPDGRVIDTDVMAARGGGLAAVAGFMLRLTVLLLNPEASKLMVLDETFAQLSEEYEPRLAEFLRELVDKTTIQLVMVTHSPVYGEVADVEYRLSQADGKTHVRRVNTSQP